MPIHDDRYPLPNRSNNADSHMFDVDARVHDYLLANLTDNTYHWLELCAEDIHTVTISPPEPEEPFIDFSRPQWEYEQEFADQLFTQEERRRNTKENLANRADKLIERIYNEKTLEMIKNTAGLEDKIKSLISDFRQNGPLKLCQNPYVQKFLSTIEESLRD